MYWMALFIAGGLETVWAVGLKYSQGFTRVLPGIVTIIGMVGSFAFLALALKHLPLGTAYAIWTGIGMVGTFICGVLLFHEGCSVPQLVCVSFILAGIVGLKALAAQ